MKIVEKTKMIALGVATSVGIVSYIATAYAAGIVEVPITTFPTQCSSLATTTRAGYCVAFTFAEDPDRQMCFAQAQSLLLRDTKVCLTEARRRCALDGATLRFTLGEPSLGYVAPVCDGVQETMWNCCA